MLEWTNLTAYSVQEYIMKIFVIPGAYRDADGYYWITGRIDDLMNVSGHLLSTAQIESALVEHSSISEAAVVGFPHDVKGTGIYCFVTPNNVSSCYKDLYFRHFIILNMLKFIN